VLGGSDVAAIRTKSDELSRKSQDLGAAMYAQQQAAGEGAAPGGDAGPADDGVVDAEIVDEDK
jgi:molecular chaperone DnaK